jgi:hypothetical protein
MFGSPVAVESNEVVFNLVWVYGIKVVNGCKKAWCTCDGSMRSGQVRVLDEMYANCADQTSARLFYGIAVAENLIVYGADVSNVLQKLPLPSRVSTFAWIRHSMNGGQFTNVVPPSLPDT